MVEWYVEQLEWATMTNDPVSENIGQRCRLGDRQRGKSHRTHADSLGIDLDLLLATFSTDSISAIVWCLFDLLLMQPQLPVCMP